MYIADIKSQHDLPEEMNPRIIHNKSPTLFLLILSLLVVYSCNRLPAPEFDYTPFENPEAGDTIRFINFTVHADDYLWDFGDGSSSINIDPEHIYAEAGIYEVQLSASNEAGEQNIAKMLTVYKPTILGFLAFDAADSALITNMEIWVYNSKIAWEENGEPLRKGLTDLQGTAYFPNMESEIFHIYAIKEGEGGFWFFSGSTPDAIQQNKVNLYSIPCLWVEDIDFSKRSSTCLTGRLPASIPELIRDLPGVQHQ